MNAQRISNDAVMTSFHGRFFIFDNEHQRYANFSGDMEPDWRTINGMKNRRVVACIGNGQQWLMKLDTDNPLLLDNRGAKIYDTKDIEQIWVTDDGRIVFIERDNDDDIGVGMLKSTADTSDKQYKIWDDSIRGPYITMAAMHGLDCWDASKHFIAVCENESTDIIVIRMSDFANRNALTAGGDIGQKVQGIARHMEESGYDLDCIENGHLMLRRALSWALPDQIGFLGAPYDLKNGITNPKEYYDSLPYHHPETYLEGIWIKENGDNSADMLTYARDSYIFVYSIRCASDGSMQFSKRLRLQSKDVIRTSLYDSVHGLYYLAGDSGSLYCIDSRDWSWTSYNAGNFFYFRSSLDRFNRRLALADTMGMVHVFNLDESGKRLTKYTQVYTGLKGESLNAVRITKNALYVCGSDWSIVKYSF